MRVLVRCWSAAVAEQVTLVEFLRARLDEDEQVAADIAANLEPTGARLTFDVRRRVSETVVETRTVLAYDPTRVLADVAAKRRMVDHLAESAARCPEDDWPEDGGMELAPLADQARWLLRLLALPYRDHAEYRAEKWAP